MPQARAGSAVARRGVCSIFRLPARVACWRRNLSLSTEQPMQQAEVFHIYHLGEQRGPYSARQVNHLYKCGFIGDETLYWRDGMEQWQPVTEIVARRRRRRNRLRRWSILLGVLATAGLVLFLFGAVTLD